MSPRNRSHRLSRVVHGMSAFALISQGMSSLGDPSSSRLLVALPLIAGVLAAASAVFHQRLRRQSRYLEVGASLVEALMCAVVGITARAHGTRYIHYAWLTAAVVLVGAAIVKARRAAAVPPRGWVSGPSAAPPESPAPAIPAPPPEPDRQPPSS